MKDLLRLLIPEKFEILFFIAISVGLLAIQNAKRFWVLLQGDTLVIAEQTGSIDDSLSNVLTNALNRISPRLVDFLLWALIGCIVFAIISVLIAFIKNLDSEAEFLHYYRSPQGRAHEINSFLAKIAVRAIGIIGIVLWFIYFINTVSPAINRWFFTSITLLKEPISWLWVLLSIITLALCLYFFAVLARLVALRPRIFATQSE